MRFEPKHLDFKKSPYTGMTRETWVEAGIYLLKGVFENLENADAPVVLPRQDYEITYPNAHTPGWKVQAEYFEGLTRTMFIAAPIIHIHPDLTINGILLRDYYKKQILRSVTPGDPNFVRTYSDMQREYGSGDPFATYQQTVETCALVIDLELCHEEIWDTYSTEEKQLIVNFLDDYAKNNTVPQNWRLFNMLDYAFLYKNGYQIDEGIMRDHAQAILNYYTGDGWYRDGHGFDYYSCWAFNMYTGLWNDWYGYEKEPWIAQQYEENSNELMKTYGCYFDKDGFTNLWGRSGIYRFAATSSFDGNFLMKNSTMNPGWARRIASGSLLQFLTRDDFLYKGVPTLGFYRQFLPMVQGYSCAESPYWMGKAFLCLHLPEDHPFWTEKENNGIWDSLDKNDTKVTVLNGPALCIANHEANGITELRTGKVTCRTEDRHSMWNYGRLAYNTKFPWEASERDDVEAQQYVLLDEVTGKYLRPNVILWAGEKENVLYRREFFDYDVTNPARSDESCWLTALNLADFVVPCGIVRVDKIRTCRRPLTLQLGSYGFPDNGTEVIEKEKNGYKAIILKGHDHTGKDKQLAMTIFKGWDEISVISSTETNPDSEKSLVIVAKGSRKQQYAYDQYYMVSQVLTKESLEDFTEDELFSIKSIVYTDPEGCGGYGPVRIKLTDNSEYVVDSYQIEGHMSL